MGACCDDCAKTGGCCLKDKKAKKGGHAHDHGHAPAKAHGHKPAKPAARTKTQKNPAPVFGTAPSHANLSVRPQMGLAVRAMPKPPAGKNWPSGQMVRFAPNPASLRLYSAAPPPGTEGIVVSAQGSTTSVVSPAPHVSIRMVNVRFMNGLSYQIAENDLQKIKPRATKHEMSRKNPDGSFITPKRAAIGAAGAALGALLGWQIGKAVR